MFDTIINKIRSLENTTLIISGIGILLLVILLAYMTKRSKTQTVVEGEPQGQDCFGGVCQVPPHIKETLTQEEQVPMPVEPIVATEPVQPIQQPVQEVEEQPVEEHLVQQKNIEEEQPVEEQPIEVQPEVVQQQINTEVLEEPMN
jgi:outer membrane biosynthesis protein TonB